YMLLCPPCCTLFPYTTLFRSNGLLGYTLFNEDKQKIGIIKEVYTDTVQPLIAIEYEGREVLIPLAEPLIQGIDEEQKIIVLSLPDRKSTRLNSSHVKISYAVF